MKRKLSQFGFAAMFAAIALASCSSNDDAITQDNGNKEPAVTPNIGLVQAPELKCSSSDIEIFAGANWSYNVSSYEKNPTNKYYAFVDEFKDQIPAKGRVGGTMLEDYNNSAYSYINYSKSIYAESASLDEEAAIVKYIKEHPDEGTKEFNHCNYFAQFVGWSMDSYPMRFVTDPGYTSSQGSLRNLYNPRLVDDNGKVKALQSSATWEGFPRQLILNTPIKNVKYLSSQSGKDVEGLYKFYTIEYKGETNTYLGLDFYSDCSDKSSTPYYVDADGVYNDYIIKLIPVHKAVEAPNDGAVEVNLAAKDFKDGEAAKLAVHVRDTSNFKVFIPMDYKYCCPVDDMYIVEKHDKGSFSYNEQEATELTREIDGETVTFKITYAENGIYVESAGISKKVLKYCRNVFGDGLTFEVELYFNEELKRDALITQLNQSTITFTDKEPGTYINTISAKNVDEAGRLLDCTVTKTAAE